MLTPVRHKPSVRRTSNVDMIPQHNTPRGGLVIQASAQDLFTPPSGEPRSLQPASLEVELDSRGTILDIEASPETSQLAWLRGNSATTGYRQILREHLAHIDPLSPLSMLLHELPVAALISGYTHIHNAGLRSDDGTAEPLSKPPKENICAGWASDATMMLAIKATGRYPVPKGPLAPPLPRSDDPAGWHIVPELPSGAMRRSRRIDVTLVDNKLHIDAMFRDSHKSPDGEETVLHQYRVFATADEESGTLHSCRAEPGPLPWKECPAAANSASLLKGQMLEKLSSYIRASVNGTASCTHLNDLFRSLQYAWPLAGSLQALAGSKPT